MEKYIWERLRRTVRNSSISLPFGTLDVIAGFLVSNILYLLSQTPILLTIYPMLLTGRGIINGILSGNISTLLHIGVVKTGLRGNTEEFYNLISSIFLLSIITGIYIGFLAILPNVFLGGLSTRDMVIGFLTAFYTILVSVYINMPITIYLASKSFESALDPDIVVYPIMSTLADLLLSLIYVSISLTIFYLYLQNTFILIITTILTVIPASIHLTYHRLGRFGGRIFREATPVIAILVGLSTFTGGILTGLLERLIENPLILIVYPAFATLMGDVGAIIGSITTTRIQLGELDIKFRETAKLLPEILGVESIALIMITISNLMAGILTKTQIGVFYETLINFYIANLILLPPLLIISISAAFLTFRRGLNPDNFVIPVETTIMDILTAAILLLILNITY